MATETKLTADQYEQVAEHMGDARNPGHADPGQTSPPARPPRGSRGGRQPKAVTKDLTPPKELTPEEKAKESASVEFTKGVTATKILHDKLARELGDVCLIEAKLKAKKWDTTGPIQYLKDKTDAIKVLNDGLFAQWVAAREFLNTESEITIEQFSFETEKLNTLRDHVADQYKAYTRDTLSEFTKLK